MEAAMDITLHDTSEHLLKRYKTESNARLARRIHGVYLASKGLTCSQIVQISGAGHRTIQKWVQRYNITGIEGLKDQPRSGQPTKLPRSLEGSFCRRIESGPSEQDEVSVLNGPAIRRLLEREFGVVYSLRGVYDLLHRLGYSCLCPRPQHERTDPHAQEELKKTSQKSSKK